MKSQPDIFKDGRWLQRSWVGKKYIWTYSGVLWNNIKERCTVGGTTQTREPTYIGTINKFKSWEEFVEWHQVQVGYGFGYQLDSDILKPNTKIYSPEHCLLIPAQLNKFLQGSKGRRGDWPQGISYNKNTGKLRVAHVTQGRIDCLGSFSIDDLDKARAVFKEAKDRAGKLWHERLINKEFLVDQRVIDYMAKWEFICDWGK